MIEDIKKLPKYKINNEVIVGNNHYISNIDTISYDSVIKILNNQPNYKSAWEELKHKLFIETQVVYSDAIKYYTQLELIEKKYNLGGE